MPVAQAHRGTEPITAAGELPFLTGPAGPGTPFPGPPGPLAQRGAKPIVAELTLRTGQEDRNEHDSALVRCRLVTIVRHERVPSSELEESRLPSSHQP